MDVAAPYRSISTATELDVLVELSRVEALRSGRQLAARVGRSHVAVNRALDGLVEAGLVQRESHPPAFLYSLNREHVAAPVVFALAGLRTELLERLRSMIADWPIAPLSASMFGSAARGDGDAASDIDLLLVRPRKADENAWDAQVAALADAVRSWTGNHAQILELSEHELRAELAAGNPTLQSIREDAVHLGGRELTGLLRSVRAR